MCVFCTAVPMTVAFGARAHAKHIERRKQAEAVGKPPPAFISALVLEKGIPLVAGTLIMGAIIYHVAIAPHVGDSLAST